MLMPAKRIRLPKTMYGRKAAPVALPNNTNPGAPMAPNLPACRQASKNVTEEERRGASTLEVLI